MQRFLVVAARWPAGMMIPLCIVEGKTLVDAAASIGCRVSRALLKKIVAKLEVPEELRRELELNYLLRETLIIMRVTEAADAEGFKAALRMGKMLK